MPYRIKISATQGIDLDNVGAIQRIPQPLDPTGAVTQYDSMATGSTLTIGGDAGLALWTAWVDRASDDWISSDPDVAPAPLPSEDGDPA